MAVIVTRAGKGSALTFTEADANFTNLNAVANDTLVTAKGDIITGTASGAVDNVAVGTNGKVLTADSTAAGGVSWQTPAATAAAITNTPAGNIAATNVQDAINELDTEKVAKAGDTMTGALGVGGAIVGSSLLTIGGATASDRVAQENIPAAAGGTFTSQIYNRTAGAYGNWTHDALSHNFKIEGTNKLVIANDGVVTFDEPPVIPFTPTGTIAATTVAAAIAEVAAEASATTVATDAIWDAKGDLVVATAANTAVRLAVGTDGYTLMADSAETSGVKWTEPGTTSAPTVTKLTSGSGTYNKPAGATRLHIVMVGGGGGGAGSSTHAGNDGGTGGTGGTSTFGLHSCVGGVGGTKGSVGAGGAGGAATLGAGIVGVAITGGGGGAMGCYPAPASTSAAGGQGGNNPLGGQPIALGWSGNGQPGATNTGAGGSGAAGDATHQSGSGGGAGAYLEGIISNPSSTYSYAVGAAGTAGTAGTSGRVGGAGAAGQIIITEYYGNFDSVLQLSEPASTKQEFTSGSGTYTTPAGVNRIRVRMVGGGGGGAGSGTAGYGNGGNGTASTFGSSLLTASAGSGCAGGNSYAGAPGTATVSAPAVGLALSGVTGTANMYATVGTGGTGGATALFGGGGLAAYNAAGQAGSTNTGSGGGGAGVNVSLGISGGGGGGAGSVDAWIWNPSSTYAYAVGAGGTAGTAGTSGLAGGAGAAGRIVVEEFYGPSHTVADTQPLSGWPGRNRIINGDFRVDQRYGGVATAAVSGGTTYAGDRWQAFEDTDGGFTTTAQLGTTPPAGFNSYMRVTITSADASLAAGQYALMQQKIEGMNISDLDWGLSTAKTITLSFRVRSSLTGTFSGALTNSAGNRSYPFTYTISAANTWETKTVTIAGDTTGTWLTTTGIGIHVRFSFGSGSTYLGTAGAWTTGSLFGATGETPLIGTNGATWDITGVQFEPGSVRTEYERKSYATIHAECQRYFEVYSTNTWAIPGTTATTMYNDCRFKVTKRTTPTMTTPSATNAGYSSTLATITPTTWAAENPLVDSFRIVMGHASGVGGHLAGSVFLANAEL